MAVIVKFFWFYLDKIAVFSGRKPYRGGDFLRAGALSTEEIIRKDHHLRPLRLRRSSAAAPCILLRPTFALRRTTQTSPRNSGKDALVGVARAI